MYNINKEKSLICCICSLFHRNIYPLTNTVDFRNDISTSTAQISYEATLITKYVFGGKPLTVKNVTMQSAFYVLFETLTHCLTDSNTAILHQKYPWRV